MPTARSAHTSEAAIREQAYYLWEQDGKPSGRENEYWQRALAASLGKPKRAKPAAVAKPEKAAAKPAKTDKAAVPVKAAVTASKPAEPAPAKAKVAPTKTKTAKGKAKKG